MSRVIAATLLGPLADEPYWDFVRMRAAEWADEHVVLEDTEGKAWGMEREWRERLWDMAVAACNDDDWIFVLDADFVLTFDPHELTEASENTVAWRFDLYDLWSPTTYRDDHYWRAHKLPRPWMFRRSAAPAKPTWHARGIHVGHSPSNFYTTGILRSGLAPGRMSILHLGWIDDETRRKKYDRYHKVWLQLSEHERLHVISILDGEVNTRELLPDLQRHLWLPSTGQSSGG